MSVLLFDLKTGQRVSVDEKDVESRIRSGQFVLGEGQTIPVISGGSARFLGGMDVFQALESGSRLPTTAEEFQLASQHAGAAEYSGIKAGAWGAARTATFGISDLLQNPEDQRKLKLIAEAQPVATGIGSVAGAFLPGAGGIAAGAGKLAGKALAPLAGSAFGKLLQTATIGGAEGAVFGVGQGVSEFALGNSDDAVESIIGDAGAGFLFGAGANVLLKGTGELFRKRANSGAKVVVEQEQLTDKALDAFGISSPAARRQIKEDAVDVVELVTKSQHPDGQPIFKSRFANRAQNAQRLTEAAEAAGSEVHRIQQEIVKASEDVVPPDVLKTALGEMQKGMIPEISALEKGLARADSKGKIEIKKALNVLKTPFDSLEQFMAEKSFYAKAWDEAHNAPGPKVWRRIERIYDSRLDDLINTFMGPEKYAEYRQAEKVFSNYMDMERALAMSIGKGQAKTVGQHLASDVAFGALMDVTQGPGVDLTAYAKMFAIRGAFRAIQERIPSAIAYSSFNKAGISKLSEKMATSKLRMQKAVSSFVEGKPIAGATTLLWPKFSSEEEKPTSLSKSVAVRVTQLNKLMNDPSQLAKQIATNLETIEELSPEVSAKMARKAVEIVNHLLSTAPSQTNYSNPLQPQFEQDWEPSTFEAIKWQWKAKVALDPLSVLEDLSRGEISEDAARTFETLYPKLYDQVKQAFAEALVKSPRKLTHNELRQLSIFFGVSLHDEDNPMKVLRNQEAYAMKQDRDRENVKTMPEKSRMAQQMQTEANARTETR